MPGQGPGRPAYRFSRRKRGGAEISRRRTRVNETIRAPQLRVIDSDGKQLGILPRREALRLAEERSLDLVEVAPQANPPVAKLMDFGKYQYEKAKREREARKARKEIEIKEIRLRPKTGENDLAVKIRRAREFLEAGAKVKVRIRFRGREITHPEVARKQLARIAEALDDVSFIEQRPGFEGRTILMILAPKTGK
ncbi:MAG TPA: translation initiation factor IF-3 [Anaerolineae bacterium]|nr:translation initiation factor IF-3 [Anaerolineae bacterium]